MSLETKEKMVHALNNYECSLKLISNNQRLIISPKYTIELSENKIDDLICVNTKKLFKQFSMNTIFFE